jgi:hypothetical protein
MTDKDKKAQIDAEYDEILLDETKQHRAQPSKPHFRCTRSSVYIYIPCHRYIAYTLLLAAAVAIIYAVISLLERVPRMPSISKPKLNEREIEWVRKTLETHKAVADPICNHSTMETCYTPPPKEMQELTEFLCKTSAVYIRHAHTRPIKVLIKDDKPPVDIVIPYRDRREQLVRFIVMIPVYLALRGMRAKLHIVHQTDNHSFNRGILINSVIHDVGPYHCVHDVDIWPFTTQNMFMHPGPMTFRRLSTHFVNRRDTSPAGGAYCTDSAAVKASNGFPNTFWGWGEEDEALFWRLLNHRDVSTDTWQSGVYYNTDKNSQTRPLFLALSKNVDALYRSFYHHPNCSTEFAEDLTKASCFSAHGGIHDVDSYIEDIRTHTLFEIHNTQTKVVVKNITTRGQNHIY